MRVTLRLLFLSLLLLAIGACSSAVEVDNRLLPLAIDPGVLSGQLSNGFRYYLRSANSAPENDRLELRLVVKAGSLNEGPHQRGYAHLVEHMAYRGTRSFSAEKIESLLRDNGLRWGEDVNATTHYSATVYRFSLHQSDEHLLPVLLSLMAEWLDSIEFEPSALIKEKRIVNAELRERYAVRGYVVDPVTVAAYAGTRYENRQPAGDVTTTHAATADGLRQYWRSHYRPDNAVLIITGGARPWQFESMITSVFSGLIASSDQGVASSSLGTVDDFAIESGVKFYKQGSLIEFLSSSDPTLSLPSLSVNLISGFQEPPSDVGSSIAAIKNRFRSQLLFSAFSYLVHERIANTRACSAISLSASLLESGQAVEHISLTLTEKAILPCLSVAFEAVNVVKGSKVTEEEFVEFESLFRQISQLSVDQYRSRNADIIASGLVDMVANGEVVLSAWDMQKILDDVVAAFDLDVLNAMIKDVNESHRLVFSVVSNSKQRVSMKEMISAIDAPQFGLATRVRSRVVHGVLNLDQKQLLEPDPMNSPELMRSVASMLPEEQLIRSMSDLSSVVKVRSQGNYHEWRLKNGASVILLQNSEYDHVALSAIADGGYAHKTAASAAAAKSLPDYLSVNGVGGYTARSLRNIMTKRQINVEPYINQFNHGIVASGEPEELSALVSMVRSYFAEPLVIEPQSSTFLEHLSASKPKADLSAAYWQSKSDDSVKSQLNNDQFIKTHRELFGSTQNFGFVFVGLLEPEQLEQELPRLIVGTEAVTTELLLNNSSLANSSLENGALENGSLSNSILIKHGDKTTDFSLILTCAASPTFDYYLSDNSNAGSLSVWHWQLLSDIVVERLRHMLREEQGFVYEIESESPTAKQLIQEIGFSVLPEDEERVLPIVSELLLQLSSTGVSVHELDDAVARDKRARKLDVAGYDAIAMQRAEQWLVGGDVLLGDNLTADLPHLNQLARCFSDLPQQIVLDSHK